MPITSKESTPPPMIGKIGPYTVFVTPPATPSPKPSAPISESPPKNAPSSPPVQPRTPPPVQTPQPPVQAPPQQFLKPAPSDGPAFGFFWNAVAKVQNAHSSLDEYVAHWFGLNQSKYQWALDDYYENKGSRSSRYKSKRYIQQSTKRVTSMLVGQKFLVMILWRISLIFHKSLEGRRTGVCLYPEGSSKIIAPAIGKVLDEIEKPIRFSSQQLKTATDNFSNLLGTGGFGAVYKGTFSTGLPVAVKVLNGSSERRIEEQFVAEVSTMGRTHHINLVQLYGFCFDIQLTALVYEFMENGSLDRLLFNKNENIEWEKLHDIAIGTAKGIAYLHEECQQRITHYDIKPENILLNVDFCPKVADFGLAKLCNREKTHMTLAEGRGTPGYAAPELWMPFPITHKCDVYSFGMLLFEILGRRRNLEVNSSDSQEWFPRWVWKKFEKGEVSDVMVICNIKDKEDKEKAGRVVVVALWCVQYLPEERPLMSVVVKMLEGGVELPMPRNPFRHLMVAGSPFPDRVAELTKGGGVCNSNSESSQTSTQYEIEIS
ncbi:unnamed protein product [Camellia sinensis]